MSPKKALTAVNGGFYLSWGHIRGIGALLGVILIVWAAGENLVLENDLTPVKERLASVESRVREVERTQDRMFGAAPSGYEWEEVSPPDSGAILTLIGSVVPLESPRRVVVPVDFIEHYRLRPSKGGVYAVLGEDGSYYAIDDVVRVLIREHLGRK